MYNMYIAKLLEICYIFMYNMIHVVCLMIPCAVSGIRLWKNLWKTPMCLWILVPVSYVLDNLIGCCLREL